MRRDSKINQFIPLHFYEPCEKLPEDDSYKIVITHTPLTTSGYDFRIANYDKNEKCWYDDGLYKIMFADVIAWATFSAGWVTGSESFPEKWNNQ